MATATSIVTLDQHTVSIVVGGASPISAEYRNGEFLPDWASFQWTRRDDGNWSDPVVKVRGPMLKKNGETGLIDASRTFGGYQAPITLAPEWLQAFVAEFRP